MILKLDKGRIMMTMQNLDELKNISNLHVRIVLLCVILKLQSATTINEKAKLVKQQGRTTSLESKISATITILEAQQAQRIDTINKRITYYKSWMHHKNVKI